MISEPVLPAEVAQLGRAIRFAFVSLVAVLSYFTIHACIEIPGFEQMFGDMFGGKPLPPLTVFLFKAHYALLVIGCAVPLLAVVTLFSSRFVASFYVLGGLCITSFALCLLIYHGLSAPFWQIIQTMQGG